MTTNFLATLEKFSVGTIKSIQDYVIIASGLDNVFVGEVVKFKSKESTVIGQVLNLEKNQVRIVLINGNQNQLKSQDLIYRTFKDVKTVAGFGLIGRIISPLGDCYNEEDFEELDYLFNDITLIDYVSVEVPAPGIIEREPVRVPCLTGVNVIDCFIPVGHGQRELIIGDRGTGKTSLALTCIMNQRIINNIINGEWRKVESKVKIDRHSNFISCIYVTVGSKRSEGARIKKTLENMGCMNYTTMVFSHADQPAALQFLAPYAGCAMGEWYRNRGYKAIIVYDDLSQHAVAYRQMSLLLRRPPGREAFPGDIFYIHSRLLERAAQLHKDKGGGSLTAFPIIETKAGDISAYIPTNVISITDGQIFLSTKLLNEGIRPAVHIGLSVSRVGASAQYESVSDLCKKIKRDYSLYQSYAGIEKLGGEVDQYVMIYIVRGKRINVFFQQTLYETYRLYQQVVCLFALTEGFVDVINLKCVRAFFALIFNKHVAARYLKKKYYPFIAYPNELECFFMSHNISFFKKHLRQWVKAYQTFFLSNIQDRILLDKKKLLEGSWENII